MPRELLQKRALTLAVALACENNNLSTRSHSQESSKNTACKGCLRENTLRLQWSHWLTKECLFWLHHLHRSVLIFCCRGTQGDAALWVELFSIERFVQLDMKFNYFEREWISSQSSLFHGVNCMSLKPWGPLSTAWSQSAFAFVADVSLSALYSIAEISVNTDNLKIRKSKDFSVISHWAKLNTDFKCSSALLQKIFALSLSFRRNGSYIVSQRKRILCGFLRKAQISK